MKLERNEGGCVHERLWASPLRQEGYIWRLTEKHPLGALHPTPHPCSFHSVSRLAVTALAGHSGHDKYSNH